MRCVFRCDFPTPCIPLYYHARYTVHLFHNLKPWRASCITECPNSRLFIHVSRNPFFIINFMTFAFFSCSLHVLKINYDILKNTINDTRQFSTTLYSKSMYLHKLLSLTKVYDSKQKEPLTKCSSFKVILLVKLLGAGAHRFFFSQICANCLLYILLYVLFRRMTFTERMDEI